MTDRDSLAQLKDHIYQSNKYSVSKGIYEEELINDFWHVNCTNDEEMKTTMDIARELGIAVGITGGNISELELKQFHVYVENELEKMWDKQLDQILHDPENQPSQYGTVPLEWYENLENKLEKIRFKVGEVIDSLDGNYEKHAIRKQLQKALE